MSEQEDKAIEAATVEGRPVWEPAVNVVSEPVAPSDDDLVPDNRDIPEVGRTTSLNAGGEFGHTPDHGNANASALAADPESEGSSDASEDK